MAYSSVPYTGDGVTVNYTVSIPFIYRAHISVYVDDVSVSFTWLSDTSVQLDVAPAVDATILIKRTTPADSRLINFKNADSLSEGKLNTNSLQLLYLLQEYIDDAVVQMGQDNSGNWTAENLLLKDLATPVDLTDAVTKEYVDDFDKLEGDGSVWLGLARRLTALADPTDDQDAATKAYVDSELTAYDAALTVIRGNGSTWDAVAQRITSLADPSGNNDAVTLQYLVSYVAAYDAALTVIRGDGTTFDADNKRILNVATPVADDDAVPKTYADTLAAVGQTSGQLPAALKVNNNNWNGTGVCASDGTVRTANFTAVAFVQYRVDSTSNTVRVALPAGNDGDKICVIDYGGNAVSNNIELAPDGSERVMGADESLFININNGVARLEYTGIAKGWVLV